MSQKLTAIARAWTTLLLALLLASSEPTRAAQRMLHFPKTPVGNLFRLKAGHQLTERKPVYEFFARAQGDLAAGVGDKLMLDAAYAVVEHPQLLDEIKDGSIDAFRFKNMEGGDDILKHIAHIKSLKHLALDQTEITDSGVAGLKTLTNLEALIISRDNSTGKTCFSLPLANLVLLEISCHDLDHATFPQIAHFRKLQILDLCRTNIDDTCLNAVGQLKALTYLDISDNKKITDRGLKTIASLKNLKFLDLRRTSVTVEGVCQLKVNPPKVVVLPGYKYSASEMRRMESDLKGSQIIAKKPDLNPRTNPDVELFAPLH